MIHTLPQWPGMYLENLERIGADVQLRAHVHVRRIRMGVVHADGVCAKAEIAQMRNSNNKFLNCNKKADIN